MCDRCYQFKDGWPVEKDIDLLGGTSPLDRFPTRWQPKETDLRLIQQLIRLNPEMTYYDRDEGPDVHEFDSKATYSKRELEQMADQLLREDANEVDSETGKRRGIKGDNPILFADHIRTRQSREIGNKTGIPDPGIVRGIFNRTHPQGRKVNSEEARKRHGASYYR